MRKLLLLAAAALAGNWYAAWQRQRRSRRLEPKASAELLGRWENEGGGVPVGGSHTASQILPPVPEAEGAMQKRG